MTTRQTLIVTAGILLTVTGGIGAFVYSISKSETSLVTPFNLAEQRAIYTKKIMAAESEAWAKRVGSRLRGLIATDTHGIRYTVLKRPGARHSTFEFNRV